MRDNKFLLTLFKKIQRAHFNNQKMPAFFIILFKRNKIRFYVFLTALRQSVGEYNSHVGIENVLKKTANRLTRGFVEHRLF